ncbi:hypothetical protein SNE40_001631 [Patella caerulea]|uniref:Uncharacterized protein n=2 Tax=Patella caerulea TaxID=87958 RepID=A0AAN8KNN7_PATCE
MRQCATWFKSVSKSEESNIQGKVVRMLILNVTGERDVAALVSFLKPCEFDAAAFTPNKKYKDISKNRADEFELSNNDEMKQVQSKRCKQIWDNTENNTMINNTANDAMVGNTKISHYFPCITDTLVWVTQGRDTNISNVTEETLPDVPSSLKDANHLQVLVTGSLHLVGGVLLQISPGLND